jgi:hypothetical protein
MTIWLFAITGAFFASVVPNIVEAARERDWFLLDQLFLRIAIGVVVGLALYAMTSA